MRAVTDFRPHTTVRLDRVGETGPDVHLYAFTLGGEPKGLDDIIRVHCIPYADMVHSSKVLRITSFVVQTLFMGPTLR